ncbi:MAG: hypothetical protein S4CHLAM45_00240 [Chlamydiales bacterium]|nr:hypothetical protein [Chlamydiales bacterium]MCH9619349.1 hypothetical protein [Chlamydiales bacterium]MCH9622153.1 hypothetical protein [Chlamydiales bacterium]
MYFLIVFFNNNEEFNMTIILVYELADVPN